MEVSKSQNVRLFDVLLLGPWLIYLASKGNLTKEQRVLLAIAGAGTVVYNARNYYLTREANR